MWITWQRIQNNCHKDPEWAQENDAETKWEYQQREKYKKESERKILAKEYNNWTKK